MFRERETQEAKDTVLEEHRAIPKVTGGKRPRRVLREGWSVQLE